MEYIDLLKDLPIKSYLTDICDKLKKSPTRFLILTAETGVGKSTAIPIALLNEFSGKILMLEPRRLAVLNIAQRVSNLLQQDIGKTCGYQMQLDSKKSKDTRFIVMTDAILIRKIQSDPLLEDVNVVVLDEFHERSVNLDLALALLKEVMLVRDNLFVIIMSATIDTSKLSEFLKAPVYQVPGRKYPVEIEYKNRTSPAKAVLQEIENNPEDKGSILVFLPGINEIRKTKDELENNAKNLNIFILHSSVEFNEQKKILSKPLFGEKRRIILSSAIAETSITVPDITVVIDSGFSRYNVFNNNTGMNSLVTRRESLFNAQQRAGRAGRVQKGKCIRLFSKSEVLELQNECEILRTDLSNLVLECAEWGVMNKSGLNWLTPPPDSSWNTAYELLNNLDCIKQDKITNKGKYCLTVALNVRLACVALIDINKAIKYSTYAQAGDKIKQEFTRRLQFIVNKGIKSYNLEETIKNQKELLTISSLISGFPDRIARIVDNSTIYQFTNGRKARFYKELSSCPQYIIAPDVDYGTTIGIIHDWESLDSQKTYEYLLKQSNDIVKVEFENDNKKLKKECLTCYGKLVLKTRKLDILNEDYIKAVDNEVKSNGIGWLNLSDKTKEFLLRVDFYIQNISTKNKSNIAFELKKKKDNLSNTVLEWLSPFIPSKTFVNQENVYSALFYYLEGDLIDKNVPAELILSNGKKCKVKYQRKEKIVPVIQVIIQQVFGVLSSPEIMNVRVCFELLSPARRPLQITDDLDNFWNNTWKDICNEMKGRYPKHNWDYRSYKDE